MNQHEAVAGTVATLGHPSNGLLAVKTLQGFWRYVESGRRVPDEDFRAGWNVYITETLRERVESREWAEPRFGEDTWDAVGLVNRAVIAALSQET